MLDRLILYSINALALLSCLLAGLFLLSGLSTSLGGEPAIGDFVAAGACAVVPYCLAGTLHRIVSIGKGQKD